MQTINGTTVSGTSTPSTAVSVYPETKKVVDLCPLNATRTTNGHICMKEYGHDGKHKCETMCCRFEWDEELTLFNIDNL